MRIGELSGATGVPVPTIKYYLREGLLPAGERTHANQVRYDERHLRRLRLVRALVEIGRVPISRVRELLAAVDSPDRGLDSTLGMMNRALRPDDIEPADPDEVRSAIERLRALGYENLPEQGYVQQVAKALATLHRFGHPNMQGLLESYAAVAMTIAEIDLATVAGIGDPEATVEAALVGTIVGEALLVALRRLAHGTVSGRVLGTKGG